jgi:glycosyltransferase involved in cell wall biosynthesis
MEEMPKVYQQADIAVVPTRASEGLSLSLLESLSCGLPVVTTPVGGLGDAVIPNYNALF